MSKTFRRQSNFDEMGSRHDDYRKLPNKKDLKRLDRAIKTKNSTFFTDDIDELESQQEHDDVEEELLKRYVR